MSTKALFADPVPAIVRVGDIGREVPQRRLMGPKRRVAQVPDRAQIPEILLDLGRGPVPGKLIHMVHEPANVPDALINSVELQIARQLLVPPAIEHLIKGLLFGMKQLNGAKKVNPS
ncbi:hypothetical protein GCM10009825_34890 [Arthrobacter humicola]|uniref:Uncharacterized protein n=1 Tax=Arthrobacter humicola TaxID=409291 RepID=A0ABN2ZLA4_9MICC